MSARRVSKHCQQKCQTANVYIYLVFRIVIGNISLTDKICFVVLLLNSEHFSERKCLISLRYDHACKMKIAAHLEALTAACLCQLPLLRLDIILSIISYRHAIKRRAKGYRPYWISLQEVSHTQWHCNWICTKIQWLKQYRE